MVTTLAAGSCDPIQQLNLCTSFKNFFIGKILKIRRDIAARLSSISSTFSNYSMRCTLHFSGLQPASVDEVASIINSTKCKNSPIDVIPTVVLKRCVDIFAPSLAHLANLSFSSGVFPEKSSWVTSFHSSRRRDRTHRILRTTVQLPTWSPSLRSWRDWFWLVWVRMCTRRKDSVRFSRPTDVDTPLKLPCFESPTT